MEKNIKYYGWTTKSDALDCVYPTKKMAEKMLISAFSGQCGFKSNKEILNMYPIVKVHSNSPMDFRTDVPNSLLYTIVG